MRVASLVQHGAEALREQPCKGARPLAIDRKKQIRDQSLKHACFRECSRQLIAIACAAVHGNELWANPWRLGNGGADATQGRVRRDEIGGRHRFQREYLGIAATHASASPKYLRGKQGCGSQHPPQGSRIRQPTVPPPQKEKVRHRSHCDRRHDQGNRQGKLRMPAAKQGQRRQDDTRTTPKGEDRNNAARYMVSPCEYGQYQNRCHNMRREIDRHRARSAASRQQKHTGCDGNKNRPDGVNDARCANRHDRQSRCRRRTAHVHNCNGERDCRGIPAAS